MDLCGRSWRRVVPEAGGKRPSPPQRSRVNGWSRPLHSFQVVAWVTILVTAIASFGVFIPFLPRDWKYVAYGATGGLFLLHFSVHLLAVSIDPAEPNVRRKKNYSEPVPTFDRSKHAHVIQDQYCHLCEVTVSPKAKHCSACNKCVSGFDHHCKWLNNCVGGRNYWCFFLSVASASAGLLCLAAVLLYVSVQFFMDPAELRTHPCYKKVSNKDTWLLFLPLFPVKVKTPVVLGIGVLVLLLDVISLLLLGHLLVFHLYLMAKKLSTFDYMTQGRQQQTPRAAAEKEELSFRTRPTQRAEAGRRPSARREEHKDPQPLQKCPSPCSTAAVHPEVSLILKRADGSQSPSTQRVVSKELLLSDTFSHQLSSTVFPENSWPTDSESKLTSPALGPRRKVLLSLSRSSGVSSATTTTAAGPGSALSLKVSRGLQRDPRPPEREEGTLEPTQEPTQEPTLADGSTQQSPSFETLAWESDLQNPILSYSLPCGGQTLLSWADACPGSPQAQGGMAATSTDELGAGPCHLQDRQSLEGTPEVAEATPCHPVRLRACPWLRERLGSPLPPPGEARDHDTWRPGRGSLLHSESSTSSAHADPRGARGPAARRGREGSEGREGEQSPPGSFPRDLRRAARGGPVARAVTVSPTSPRVVPGLETGLGCCFLLG